MNVGLKRSMKMGLLLTALGPWSASALAGGACGFREVSIRFLLPLSRRVELIMILLASTSSSLHMLLTRDV